MYPEVFLTGRQALSVGVGFHTAVAEANYTVLACSILPQHVHLVFGPHERQIQRIAGHLKGRATQQLKLDGLHPLAAYRQPDGTLPSLWCRNCWKVFIFTQRHFLDAIKYVEDNPLKEGKPRQHWSFVRQC
jgi:REP element-mobilizing transposase RayT